MRVQPCEYADSTAPYRSSSVISLLMTVRSRHDPASGANVRPVRRADPTVAAMPTVNASTRRLGSDTDTCPRLTGSFDDVGDDPLDAAEVGGRQRREAHLVVAGAAQALAHHRAHLRLGTLAHRPRDHPRLAETTATGAAAEHLDVQAVVHDLGEGHELVAWIRPLGEVRDRALHDRLGDVGVARRHRREPFAVVLDVVHRRHVDTGDRGELMQHALARSSRATARLPRAHDLGDLRHDFLAVTDREPVDEVGERLRVVGAVAARPDERMLGPTVRGPHRHAREVDAVEDVRVHELGREVERDQVELTRRAVRVDREQRQLVTAQQRLEIEPRRVRALGDRVVALVQDLVEDLQPLVGQTDLVGIGVDEQPRHLPGVVVGSQGAVFATDVASRLLHLGQERLEPGPE